jgi:hypothetical protein
LWDGHLARPCIVRGPDARTTRNFGYFFNWKSLNDIIRNYSVKELAVVIDNYLTQLPGGEDWKLGKK